MKPLASVLFLAGSVAWAADAQSSERIQSAAEKGLVLLQKTQQIWVSKQHCNSCHQVLLPTITLQDARDHGLVVDEKIARAAAATILDNYKDLDKAFSTAR